MATLGQTPVLATPAEALEAMERHLSMVLRGKTLSEVGWKRPNPLTLLIPLTAIREDGGQDEYLFRFYFGYYPEWPPSVRAVNPETSEFRYPEDNRWVPRVQGTSELGFHPQYQNVGQLVCNSTTLEFYQVNHGCDPAHVWDAKRHTFALTLAVLRDYLKPPYYKGRQS